ncbi:lysylphosphatidylglycerol synthase domain-containing protein [Streptomyces rubiginosohelvolus]
MLAELPTTLILTATFIGCPYSRIRAFEYNSNDPEMIAIAVIYLVAITMELLSPTPGGIGTAEAAFLLTLIEAVLSQTTAAAIGPYRLLTF